MIIDPILKSVTIRPFRKRTSYTMTLKEVSDFICKSVILGK